MDQLYPLSQIFNDTRIFRIPDYQRGYAWRADNEVAAFWKDLVNLEVSRKHYTGMITLQVVPDEITSRSWQNEQWLIKGSYTPEHVVDGQQRLTTAIILIQAICDFYHSIYPKKKDEDIFVGDFDLKTIREKYIVKENRRNITNTYVYGYEVDNPSFEFLKKRIFHEAISTKETETFYTLNLENALKFFTSNIKDLYDSDGETAIEELFTKLTQNMLFNLFEIRKDYAGFDVFAAFETMNNRGKKLSNLELLKNRLIYLTTLYPDTVLDEANKSQLRTVINDAWKVVYEQLGHNKKHPLNDDEFLFAHWVMYFKYSRTTGSDYVDFLLNKQFTTEKLQSKKAVLKGIKPVEELKEMDINDGEISTEDDIAVDTVELLPEEIKRYVLSMKDAAEMWYATWFPNDPSLSLSDEERLWIDRMNRIGISYFRPLVTVALLIKSQPEERVALFKSIERFLFVVFRCQSARSNYCSSEFYRQTRYLLSGESTINDIISILSNNSQYSFYEDENDSSKVYFDYSYLLQAIKNQYDSNGAGYYGWGTLRYFLYEYESYLSDNSKSRKSIVSWESFIKPPKTKISIEHILPQTPTNAYWEHRFGKLTEKQLLYYQGSLGNLMLLDQSINSSLQNDSFPDKKKVKTENNRTVRHGYSNGSYSEVEVSHEKDWTPSSIIDRGIRLLKFMEERWGLEFESEEDMKKLLFLDQSTLKHKK